MSGDARSGEREERARRHDAIRREIARTVARTAPLMARQAARMRSISAGRGDPFPEMDGEFMDRLVEERRTGTERTPPGRVP